MSRKLAGPGMWVLVVFFSTRHLAGQSNDGSDHIPSLYRYTDVSPAPLVFGAKADVEIGFRVDPAELDTALWLRLRAAYGTAGFYRYKDGSIYDPQAPGSPPPEITEYKRFNTNWGLGVLHGLHFDKAKDRNDLDLLLAWTGWVDVPDFPASLSEDSGGGLLQSLAEQSPDPGTHGVYINNLVLDLLFDGTSRDPASKNKSGFWINAATALAPLALNPTSDANYLRVSASSRMFLPLWHIIDSNRWNLFSGYLAANIVFDQLWDLGIAEYRDGANPIQTADGTGASGLPHPVSQQYGGRFFRTTSIGSVRGFAPGYLDATTKLNGTLELRINGPAMFRPDINLVLIFFADAGYFADPPGLPDSVAGTPDSPPVSGAGPESELATGFRASTGLGLFINLFDGGALGIYTSYILYGRNHFGNDWVPVSVTFDLHF